MVLFLISCSSSAKQSKNPLKPKPKMLTAFEIHMKGFLYGCNYSLHHMTYSEKIDKGILEYCDKLLIKVKKELLKNQTKSKKNKNPDKGF